jgi:hypothetical protein
MKRLALACVAGCAVLGVGAWWATRPPPAPTIAPRTWLADLDTSAVTRIEVSADGASAAVWREPLGVWLVRTGNGPAWPVEPERVRAGLRLLADAGAGERLDAATPASGTRVVLHRGERRDELTIGGEALGGTTLLGLAAGGDQSALVLRAPLQVAEVFTPRAVGAWRTAQILSSEATDAGRVRVDVDARVLELSRRGGSWMIETPVRERADAGSAAGLVGRLTSLRAERFLDAGSVQPGAFTSPRGVIRLETTVREAAGGARRTLVQQVRVGPGLDAGGQQFAVETSAWWEEPGGQTRTPAWGPVLAAVAMPELKQYAAADGLPSRVAMETPSADVKRLRLSEPPVAGASGPTPRAVLQRTLEGWRVGEGVTARDLTPQELAGLKATLGMLCDSGATAAILEAPKGVRPLAVLELLDQDTPRETARIGLVSVELASGLQQAIVVQSGAVYRVYPAMANADVLAWLGLMMPGEG